MSKKRKILYLDSSDIMEIENCSTCTAYRLIRKVNQVNGITCRTKLTLDEYCKYRSVPKSEVLDILTA